MRSANTIMTRGRWSHPVRSLVRGYSYFFFFYPLSHLSSTCNSTAWSGQLHGPIMIAARTVVTSFRASVIILMASRKLGLRAPNSLYFGISVRKRKKRGRVDFVQLFTSKSLLSDQHHFVITMQSPPGPYPQELPNTCTSMMNSLLTGFNPIKKNFFSSYNICYLIITFRGTKILNSLVKNSKLFQMNCDT